jgi:hypothetical protein
MQPEARRGIRRSTRPVWLVAAAALASLVLAACLGPRLTPQVIYTILPAKASPTPSVTPAAGESTSASVTPAPTATFITASVSSTTVSSTASDGRWKVTFQKPVVGGVPTATAMSTSVTTKVNAYIASFTGSGLPVPASGNPPSTLDGGFSVAYVSPTLLSLRFTVTTFVTGAAHPVTEVGSINFNVANGAVIQLPDIFTSQAAALPVLKSKAHAALSAKLGSSLAWPASVTMSDFGQAWVFTPGGLELSWSQGTIAPMASGTVTIGIPWSQLKSVLANPGPAAGFAA